MNLAELTGNPTRFFPIGGTEYKFSELTLDGLGRLQSWILKHVPHPLEAVKPHLAGLDPADRAELLDRARKDALKYPPAIGTAAGAAAILGTEEGQVEVLFEALRVHQPETTPDGAKRHYRQLMRDAAAWGKRERAEARREGREPREFDLVRKLFAVAFGTEDYDDDLADDDDGLAELRERAGAASKKA